MTMDSIGILLVFSSLILGTQGIQVEVTPREILVLPNQNVSVMCRVPVPLQYCRVVIPGMEPLNLNSKLANSEVSYYGAGLPEGQCGFTLNRVTEKNNGQVRCNLGVETDPTESVGTSQLIVARPPKIPEMELSRNVNFGNSFGLNDLLQASCTVREGRPVANISWFLNEEPIYSSDLTMPRIIDLGRDNLQTKIQNMSRQLQATDNGKFLRCVAYHPAYPKGHEETSRQLDVKYGPLPQTDIHKFGYMVGQPGLITVVVESNPRPNVEWDVGGERIKERQNDQTGRFEAEEVKDIGNGRYDISLRIAEIQKEDTEKSYTLRAYNNVGRSDYTVLISTSPEPEGLELGIGGIIGIVIAILAVLFVVFILIFAKITGRWCFSVTSEARNLGESDTESADVRPKDTHLFSPIKLTQFFKKNKDKVTAMDEPEAKKTDEDIKVPLENTGEEVTKEGLVYAELDLVVPGNVKVKDDNEKTEYAEIVYTPQDEKK